MKIGITPGYPPPGYATQGYAMPYAAYGQHPGYTTAPQMVIEKISQCLCTFFGKFLNNHQLVVVYSKSAAMPLPTRVLITTYERFQKIVLNWMILYS